MTLAGEVGELFAAWGAAAKVALVVAQPSGTIDYANEDCRLLCGLTAGDQLLDMFVPREIAQVNAALDALHTVGRPLDATLHLAASGTIARFVITRTVDEHGDTRALVGAFRDVTEQALHERRLEYEANHDDLTGVLKRAFAIRKLEERYLTESRLDRGAMAVLFIDLDNFKDINDGYGHLVGDEVLKEVAKRLVRVARDEHEVARLGGDEFLVVLGACESTDQALAAAGDVAEALAPPFLIGELSIDQRFSIGVSVDMLRQDPSGGEPAAPPSVRVERLLAEADVAMYVAKQDKVSVALADESTRTWSARRLVIDRDLRAALRSGEILFRYQPIVDLEADKWMAAEALLRWEHPELGMLPPGLVIERAEVIGCIDELTKYTIDSIARDWAQVVKRAPVMFHHQVSMNASARQLSWDAFVETHLDALEGEGLTPAHLLIEVTESSRIELHEAAAVTLNRMAEHGTRICLDDFGVGYSALSYFTQFTVHAVKIDRSLVSELRGDSSIAEKLLLGVVRIADDLGARVVGEGVEHARAAELCRALGVTAGQGWYFGHPLQLDDFCELASTRGLPRSGDRVVIPGNPQIVADRASVDGASG